ncbi:phosphatidylinositol polyphosphate 5-phosphatase type IV isoform X2 [Ictalurus furcatus]|uniref:phosphatidylinositol polyphosphate 5-phosphatase type IV isoform X2 n=1 Tax=Ictalurus furcatus TaxID=66913 RepID=UPI0023500C6F|nr:phosphatidylinositol polyphosphate 5-phosphatase type IV isoform X2 [Ictalurus furcatus]
MFAGRDGSEKLQHSSALHPLSSKAWSLKPENNVEDRNCGVMEGYLFKQASNTFRIWNRRWFKVEDNKLMYQGFKNGPTVMMNDLRLCEVKNFNNTGCHFCFEVTSSTKSCVLKADSEMTKQIWMRAIQNRETSWTDSSHDSELKDPVRKMVKKHKVMNVQAKMREVALRLEMAENPGAKEQQEDEDHKMNVLQNRRPISSNILTAEELDRVCPGRQIGISIVTWNMAGQKELPDNLNDLFPPTTADFSQDMYVIGVQEGCPNREEWQCKLQETLGQRYVMLHAASLGVLSLTIFTRTDLAHYFSQVKDATVTTRFFPRIKTKGSVGVGFTFCGMSFLFITSHFNFSPGVSKVSQRIQDYKKMITGLALPQHSNGTKPDPNLDVTTQYDVVFCFGDFNFRLTEDRESVMATLYHHTGDNMDVLLQHDQLSKEMDKGSVFRGFREAPIHFTPTYKFNMGCDVYDTSSKHRTPSYTDRILYRSKKKKDIKVIQYDSCPTIKTSDHRPVMGTFQVKVQPGTGWYGVHHCPLF